MSSVFIEISINELDNLPEEAAVYAFWASKNNQPINCRYVGQTDNLRRRIKEHFSDSLGNDCLKKFLASDKAKILEHILLPGSTSDERLEKEQEWITSYKPKCNK